MSSSTQFDVIIIGTGAGGGTLVHKLAPSGKRILLLERGDQQDSCQAADELGGDIKHCVPARDLAQSPESQRRRRIDVRPGLLAPR